MINISIPVNIERGVFSILVQALRRAVDGTVVPLFVDYKNQRIVVGGISASAAPAKMELATGNFKVVAGGQGVILPNAGATNYYLLSVSEVTNDDGTIEPVLTLTKQ